MVIGVTFNGGAGDFVKGERGGVQCLMEDYASDVSWMNDFGLRYEFTDEYIGFPDTLRPEASLDIIEQLGFFFNIPGIFREDYEELRHNTSQRKSLEFLFTHGHVDHIGGLQYLSADHILRTNELTQTMLWIMQQTRGRMACQYVDIFDQATHVPSLTGGTKILRGDPAMIRRNFQTFKEEEPFLIGGKIPATAYSVDHSFPGSVGFIFETSAGMIGFSGDLRMRGKFPERTHRFIDALVEHDVSYFFFEGSLLEMEHGGTEVDLTRVISALIKDKAFAVYAAPPNDLDRLTSLYNAACATGRTLVLNPAQAFSLCVLNGTDGYPTVDKIAVYFGNKANRFVWEKGLMQHKVREVTTDEMSKHQDAFLVYCSAPNSLLHLLNAVKPARGSVYFRSHPAPWTGSMFEHERRIRNILTQFGMYDGPHKNLLPPYNELVFYQAHITGHNNATESEEILRRHNWTVIPYHCRSPIEDFIQKIAKGMNIIVPERGKTLYLGT